MTDLSWYWNRLKVMSGKEMAHRLKCRFMRHLVLPNILRKEAPPLSWAFISSVKNVNEQYFCTWDPGEYIHVFHHQVHWQAVNWQENIVEHKQIDAQSPDYHDTKTIGDVKVLWEQSRFKEFVAWAQSGDFDRISCVLSSWLAENPPYLKIHWTSALEVAIRSWVLIRVLDYAAAIRNEPLGQALSDNIRQLLYVNGWYIAANLSYGSSANNHLLGEALGLCACGLAFADTKIGRTWLQRGEWLFAKEYMRQTYETGACGEGSLYYQCYVADMGLLYCLLMPEASRQLRDRVARVVDSILWWAKWSESLPLIGDDDGGIFTPHGDAMDYYHCYQEFSRLRTVILPEIPVVETPPADFALLQVGDLGQVFIRIGPFGLPPLYAHSHADLGSVLGFRAKQPWLVDPGTGRYFEQAGLRTQMRLPTSHNTIAEEGAERWMNGPFMWKRQPQSATLSRIEDGLVLTIQSETIKIEREIRVDRQGRLLIHDRVINPRRRRVYQTWNFATEPVAQDGHMPCSAMGLENSAVSSGCAYMLGDVFVQFSPASSAIRLLRSHASSCYNTVETTPSLQRADNEKQINWTTVFTLAQQVWPCIEIDPLQLPSSETSRLPPSKFVATQPLRVLMVGPGLKVKGGISSVESLIMKYVPQTVRIRHISTSEDGSASKKILVFLYGIAMFIWVSLTFRPQLVHIHFSKRGSTWRKFIIMVLAACFGLPVLLHAHSGDFPPFFDSLPGLLKKIVALVFRRARTLVTLSASWKSYYSSSLHVPIQTITVLPNPVEFPRPYTPQPYMPQPDAPQPHTGALRPVAPQLYKPKPRSCITYLGKMCEEKGTFDLIAAYARIPQQFKRKAQLVLAGNGEIKRVKQKVIELGMQDDVLIVDWLTPSQRDELLQGTQIFALPSYFEGMPMSLLEAMANGIAVVTTPVGSIPEVIENGIDGILVPAGDVAALSSELQNLIENRDLCHALGEGAIRKASRFRVEAYMSKLCKIYAHCLDPLSIIDSHADISTKSHS